MRHLVVWVVSAALIASAAQAQQQEKRQRRGGPGGRGGPGMMMRSPLFLLTQKAVQEELKLSDEQVQKAQAAIGEQMRTAGPGLQGLEPDEAAKRRKEMSAKADKVVAEILTPEQAKRFKQVRLQVQGVRAMSDPEIVKELKITDDQQRKIKEIQDDNQKEMRKLRQDAGATQKEMRERQEELRKSTHEKLMSILTDDQKTKWKEMTGEPFKGQLQFGPPGGGRRQQ